MRRVDRHLIAVHGGLVRAAGHPLVVDLGFGATPVTTVELHQRLREVRTDVTVVGLEIDQSRVDAAMAAAGEGLSFRRGGFELAGLQPLVVRALNVLRQYDETAAAEAWTVMTDRLQPDGLLIEGTCDELGRRAAWVTLTRDGPQTLTLAAHLQNLDRPSDLAERLPKALIHHNVPGRPVHDLLRALDEAWDRSAAHATFGKRQRWLAMCGTVEWQVMRSGAGEVTVPWTTVAP